MRWSPTWLTAVAGVGLTLATSASTLYAQSLLDRPDNISTDWVGSTGVLYFNFVHRFIDSPPPERKVTNFPTFLVATGIASQALVGFNYATNSSLSPRFPNEWEFFGRYAPLQQDDGAPVDLGGQVDYNLAVSGVDGELSLARRDGPVRLVAVARAIADTIGGNSRRFSFGGGGTFKLGRFFALAGDVASLTNRGPSERVAWSAGVHLALPNTPHTLSIHVSNATTSTIQGLSRGSDTRRYGFEFTIPIHLSRFTSSPEAVASPETGVMAEPTRDSVASTPTSNAPPTPAVPDTRVRATPNSPPVDSARAPVNASAIPPAKTPPTTAVTRPASPRPSAKTLTARMKGQVFIPDHLEVAAGTTITWKNQDALIHTVTAADKSFNSGVIGADASYSHTFNKPGTYAIICLAHPFMKATVVVK